MQKKLPIHFDQLLQKYEQYGLIESDIANAQMTFSEFLIAEIKQREVIIEILCDAINNGKSIDDVNVQQAIEEYQKTKAS